MSEYIEIACAGDDGYTMPLCVFMISVCENNKENKIRFHVMTSGFSSEHETILRQTVERYNQQINIYIISDELTKDFPIGQAWQSQHVTSIATYYRLFLANILPEKIEKVLYLDADIIVRKSLRNLWETDLRNFAFAGVHDTTSDTPLHYNLLHFPMSLDYYNAGVILINLKYWRAVNALNMFCKYARENFQSLNYHDQDIINYIFRENKMPIDVKYNMMTEFLYSDDKLIKKHNYDFIESIKLSRNDPVIVHFIKDIKPWFKDCKNPFTPEWRHYLSISPFAGIKLKYKRSFKHRMFDMIFGRLLINAKIIEEETFAVDQNFLKTK